jgi:hypothetical protein
MLRDANVTAIEGNSYRVRESEAGKRGAVEIIISIDRRVM